MRIMYVKSLFQMDHNIHFSGPIIYKNVCSRMEPVWTFIYICRLYEQHKWKWHIQKAIPQVAKRLE
jgi:hypothetical protein